LRQQFQGRVSIERIVSGPGIVNVYRYLTSKFPEKVSNENMKHEILSQKEGAAIISQNYEKDELCRQAFDIFLSAYGCEVGNAALRFLPDGGIYVAGGIVAKNAAKFTAENSQFRQALHDKGRLSNVAKCYTVYAVLAEDMGIRGAKSVACQLLK